MAGLPAGSLGRGEEIEEGRKDPAEEWRRRRVENAEEEE